MNHSMKLLYWIRTGIIILILVGINFLPKTGANLVVQQLFLNYYILIFGVLMMLSYFFPNNNLMFLILRYLFNRGDKNPKVKGVFFWGIVTFAFGIALSLYNIIKGL